MLQMIAQEPCMAKPPRRRVDALMIERGLARDVDQALRLVLAGKVHTDNRRLEKPGELIRADESIHVRQPRTPFVGRGGEKLEGALAIFALDPTGRVCADLGASTGGFTDCLLQHGALHVTAIDVGRAQLHERLRQDPRVTCREQTDVRNLVPGNLPADVSLIVGDLSFIALRRCIPAIANVAPVDCDVVLLIKPQFELPRDAVPEGGIVDDPTLHRQAILLVLEAGSSAGLAPLGVKPSPVKGTEGNQEYFVHFRRLNDEKSSRIGPPFALDQLADQAFD